MTQDLIPIDVSIKDLSTTNYSDLLDKSNRFIQIFSRAGDPTSTSLVEFTAIGDMQLNQIADKMPEINRATKLFGKQNSQVSGRLMSLTMLATGPLHRMKQCLAKIERKRGALKENIFKLRRDRINLEELIERRDSLRGTVKQYQKIVMSNANPVMIDEVTTKLRTIDVNNKKRELDLIEIDIEEKVCNITDANIYIEAALKEIGQYQTAYEQIMKNCDIPENWDEKYFEENEISEHVRMAFLHTIRDLTMTGALNVGTHEYLEQMGVHPYVAVQLGRRYLASCEMMMKNGEAPGITHLHKFLDDMYDNFKGEYKKVVSRIGLDHLIDDDFVYKTPEFTGYNSESEPEK